MEDQNLATNPESTDLVPVERGENALEIHTDKEIQIEPHPPDDMPEKERRELARRAENLVEELLKTRDRERRELEDGIANVGMIVQQKTSKELDGLWVSLNELSQSGGAGAEVSQKLSELRMALTKLSPDNLSQPSMARAVFGSLGIVDKVLSNLEIIKRIAIQTQSVATQTEAIERSLDEGRVALQQSNIRLEDYYDVVAERQVVVARNAYLAELLMRELQARISTVQDSIERRQLQEILHSAAMQAQDLRAAEQACVQFEVLLDMTRNNNRSLAQQVVRTKTIAKDVINVAVAILREAQIQGLVADEVRKTREFIGEMMEQGSAVILQHTRDIGDMYKDPVIAMEKMRNSYNNMISAIDETEKLKAEGLQAAAENIRELATMTEELKRKASGISEDALAPMRTVEV